MMTRARLAALAILFFGTCSSGHVIAQPAGAPPIDPRAMSGIPRADPQTEPGTVTVRCLLGGFAQPAAGVAVTLELKSADGSKLETRTAIAGADGRASFTDLAAFFGGTAVAGAELDGEPVRSQPIPLSAREGFRVLLVKGGGDRGAGEADPKDSSQSSPQSASPHGDVPLPGTPFVNPSTPKGTVLVGTLNLGPGGGPISGARVRLLLTLPDGTQDVREATSDAHGTARFDGLDALPPETSLVAEAELFSVTERSQPFSLAGKDSGMAVVLATRGRRQLMNPRGLPTLPPGTVRVTVFGPDDRPVADVPVTVVKRDATGFEGRFDEVTDEGGVARVRDIPVTTEGLFHVELTYADAPWRSTFFTLDDRMGAAVEMRVFPVTADLSVVRSAAQFNVEPLENDFARIDQIYQVYVSGDAAYWPGRPYKLLPAEGATGMVVSPRAHDALQHDREAPFATIENPLPPGEVIDLTTAYVLAHDGTAEIRWTPPLPVVETRVVVDDGLEVVRGARSGPTRPPHRAGEPRLDVDVYDLGERAQGQAYDFAVAGLVTRPRLFKVLGLGLGFLVVVTCVVALAVHPRRTLRARLLRRKEALLRRLDSAGDAERPAIIAALDRVFYQLDALQAGPRHLDPGAAWADRQS